MWCAVIVITIIFGIAIARTVIITTVITKYIIYNMIIIVQDWIWC